MNIPQTIVRVIGAIMIVLGLLIWTGGFDALIPIHILIGIVLVIALWWLASAAYRAGVAPGLVVAAAAIGFILPIVGIAQQGVLEADKNAWVPIVHLALGLAAIGLGEALAGAMRRGSVGRLPEGPPVALAGASL